MPLTCGRWVLREVTSHMDVDTREGSDVDLGNQEDIREVRI